MLFLLITKKKLSHLKKKNIESTKISANAEIIKSIKMNQHLYEQYSSDSWKPIPFVLVPEFYDGIVNKEKAVPNTL